MLLVLLLAASLAGACDGDGLNIGGCDYSGSLDNGGVTLEGGGTYVGDDGGAGGVTVDLDDGVNDPFANCTVVLDGRCRANGPGRDAPAPGTVTLADIAHLVPDLGTLKTEPSGWAALRLPANAVSSVARHEVSATLLGAPASVRFTPVEWYWDYGDGASATSPTGGATWAALGLPEFEPTATSHAYRSRGTYTITVSITFTAEYQIAGGPWIAIAGTLVRTGPSTVIQVFSATTVLVDEDCLRNPRGPGC
ncbi:PKD domain-containing protein [Schumannella luteola]